MRLWKLWFVSVIFLSACSPEDTSTVIDTSTPTVLRYGLVFDPATLDPHLTESVEAGIVLRHVYDTLIYRDPDTLNFVPGLASDWAVSEDGLAVTIRLRQDVYFHNGERFDANAVAFNLDRIVAVGESGGLARRLLGPYRGYQIIDAFTIILQLSEPYVGLLDALSQPYLGMAAPNTIQEFSAQRYQFHQVGTGPYRLTDFIPGSFVQLSINESYAWGPAFYDFDAVESVQEIRFQYYIEASERSEALLQGDIDVVSQLLPTEARSLAVNPQITINPRIIPGQPLQLVMNETVFPTDNTLIRQALILATNRTEVANLNLQGFTDVAWGPLSRVTVFHTSQFENTYAYDLLGARGQIETAGFSDSDNDGIFDVDGVPLEISVVVLRDDVMPEMVERLSDQWLAAGVRTNIQLVPTMSSLLSTIESGQYNLVGIREDGIEPNFLVGQLLSNSDQNWSGVNDPELDEVVLRVIGEQNIQARANLYVDIQREMLERALILPIVDNVNIVGAGPSITRLSFHANGIHPILPNVRIGSS
jgi:peptide/nickel transport system substrate-binding protein